MGKNVHAPNLLHRSLLFFFGSVLCLLLVGGDKSFKYKVFVEPHEHGNSLNIMCNLNSVVCIDSHYIPYILLLLKIYKSI